MNEEEFKKLVKAVWAIIPPIWFMAICSYFSMLASCTHR